MDICEYLQEDGVMNILQKYKLKKRISHLRRVEKYSVTLFNLLASRFELEEADKNMLRYSVLLHDIGYSIDKVDHHKHSKNIVLKDRDFDSIPIELRNILALIVASHRKKIDKDIESCNTIEKAQVLRLTAILRLADALDYSENNTISDTYIKGKTLYLKAAVAPSLKALEKLKRKAELFKYSFQLDVVFGEGLWHK